MGQGRVKAFLLHYADMPWQRGTHDCVLFIWKFANEVYQKPYADPDKYPFHDYKSARRALKSLCSDYGVETFEQVLDTCYYRVDYPIEGGIVAKPDIEGLTGYSYGVCHAGCGYFVGEKGITAMELNPSKDLYWSIF
jgi:hypothetical protein